MNLAHQVRLQHNPDNTRHQAYLQVSREAIGIRDALSRHSPHSPPITSIRPSNRAPHTPSNLGCEGHLASKNDFRFVAMLRSAHGPFVEYHFHGHVVSSAIVE